MKSSRWILTIWLAATAWAQTPAANPHAAAPPAKPSAVSARPATVAAVKMPAAAAVKAKLQKPSASAKAVARSRAVSSSKAAAPKKVALPARRGRNGQRDPFVSPLAERARSGPGCSGTGKRCLYVGDISLQGIVQSEDGVIAVVISGTRTYFLREHDPLADGDVEKITRDSITLRQRSSDILGRPMVRLVTRKLGAPAA